jgi:hypothetical protein
VWRSVAHPLTTLASVDRVTIEKILNAEGVYLRRT